MPGCSIRIKRCPANIDVVVSLSADIEATKTVDTGKAKQLNIVLVL